MLAHQISYQCVIFWLNNIVYFLLQSKFIKSHVEYMFFLCKWHLVSYQTESSFRILGVHFVISLIPWTVLRKRLKLFSSPKCLKFVEQLRMLLTPRQIHALALRHNKENCPNRRSLYIFTEIPNMWNTLMHSNYISATVVAREQTEITNFISFRKCLHLKLKSRVPE